MWFGEVPASDAAGAILGHSVRFHGGSFRKGRRLSLDDIKVLAGHDIASVFVARLEKGDIGEDEAAGLIGEVIGGPDTANRPPATGRVNLHALCDGLAMLDAARISSFNQLHESVTLATAAPFTPVSRGQIIATIKIIPFAVPGQVMDAALALIADAPLIDVAPYKGLKAGLIMTTFGARKLLEKTRKVMAARIAALGGELGDVVICEHAIEPLAGHIAAMAAAGQDIVLVFGASAIVDRGDVVPAAISAARGQVDHLGLPVDPGNLLALGQVAGKPVIGVPSCARSPSLNGFDLVLARLMAGVPVRPKDLMAMGAGGLLKDVPRPSPREDASR